MADSPPSAADRAREAMLGPYEKHGLSFDAYGDLVRACADVIDAAEDKKDRETALVAETWANALQIHVDVFRAFAAGMRDREALPAALADLQRRHAR